MVLVEGGLGAQGAEDGQQDQRVEQGGGGGDGGDDFADGGDGGVEQRLVAGWGAVEGDGEGSDGDVPGGLEIGADGADFA